MPIRGLGKHPYTKRYTDKLNNGAIDVKTGSRYYFRPYHKDCKVISIPDKTYAHVMFDDGHRELVPADGLRGLDNEN